MLLSLAFDHRELPIFADQGHNACQFKTPLHRRAKRRIAFKNNCSAPCRIRFAPWDCFRVNSMLITEKGIGDSERFTAFEQQRVNERNSGPHAGYAALAQATFDAVQICAGIRVKQ